jgi:uncharacterized protein YciI
MERAQQRTYYVAFAESTFSSWAEVQQQAPYLIAEHIARSQRLREEGAVLMAGAFLEPLDAPVTTMAVLASREAAEAYMRGDPFVVAGHVKRWYIREWANMFYAPPSPPTT